MPTWRRHSTGCRHVWTWTTGLRKAVLVKPQLLNYSVEDNMAPTLEWFQTRLDLDAAQLTVVLRLPQLLGYSVDANMEPKLDWLQKRLTWTRRS